MERHQRSVAASVDRERVQPHGLTNLLHWFRERWVEEVPDTIHSSGVWHDKEGASALGAPQWADEFRRFLLASPHELDGRYDDWAAGADPDAAYLRPLRSAMARMAGRDLDSERGKVVAYLFRVARNGFDWRSVAMQETRDEWWAAVGTEWAIGKLWRIYRPRPEPRSVREVAD